MSNFESSPNGSALSPVLFRCKIQIPPPMHPTYNIDKVILDAVKEDGGVLGDITSSAIFGDDDTGEGVFISKDDGVVAGICVADRIFQLTDDSLKVKWEIEDGDPVSKGTIIGQVQGSAKKILLAERLCLNFLQRMSGIATLTSHMVKEIEAVGSQTKLLDTRKTMPGLRLLDKWAVLIGGGMNHRMGLFDMMMIKDNHIAAAGSIQSAISKAQIYLQQNNLHSIPIEVETSSLEEVQEVQRIIASLGEDNSITRVMLDNMVIRKDNGLDLSLVQQAVEILQGMILYFGAGIGVALETKVEVEVSGNVDLQTVGPIAMTGVTFVSCGALTHSVKAMDISLKIKTKHEN